MTKDEIIIAMARELVMKHGIRMCDEDGETHGEELYCVGVDDVVEIIKQAAAHEREKWEQALPIAMDAMMLQEREACAKVADSAIDENKSNKTLVNNVLEHAIYEGAIRQATNIADAIRNRGAK